MNKIEAIRKAVRTVIKEIFDKSSEVTPKTVNNLQGNGALMVSEPYQLKDTSKPEEIGEALTDVVMNALVKTGKVKVSDSQVGTT
ncbi:MAG: hypothetical protein H0W61_08965 [Bacteroidetes bacterium]|nr:hypothetical protein [Bacteroidota bacterium]